MEKLKIFDEACQNFSFRVNIRGVKGDTLCAKVLVFENAFGFVRLPTMIGSFEIKDLKVLVHGELR